MLMSDGVARILRLDHLETPRLLLDVDRLERNCVHMRERCRALGVALDRELAGDDGLGGIEVERQVDGAHPVGGRRVVFTTNQGRGAFAHLQSLFVLVCRRIGRAHV